VSEVFLRKIRISVRGFSGFFGRLLPAPRRPSPSGRRVGSSEKLSRPAQGSRAFRPAYLHLGYAKEFPRGYSRAIARLVCSSGYRTNRQFPGRDLHPLAFETQEVSSSTCTSQLTSDLLSCRTARHLVRAALDWCQALRCRSGRPACLPRGLWLGLDSLPML